jgi:hypothetical protein
MFRRQGRMLQYQGYGANRHGGASEFDLSLGRIVDTLRADYPAFFERSPDFDIYDEFIVFELGLGSSETKKTLRGKRNYRRVLSSLQNFAASTVRDGQVRCHIKPVLSSCNENLRVNWTCQGRFCLLSPLYISAISVYSIAPQARLSVSRSTPSHPIDRHAIEFLEIHPPSLRRMLMSSLWWIPQTRVAPVLASEANCFNSMTDPESRMDWRLNSSLKA